VTSPGYDLEAEFSQAYRDHAPGVRLYALRAAFGNRPAAADAVQEAFMKAYRGWPSFRQMTPGRQRAWLSTCARNSIIDSWRKTSAEYLADPFPEPSDSRISEETVLDSITAAGFWKEITATVPLRAARAAFLKWNEDWTISDIARHLGVDRATVLRDVRAVHAAARHPGSGGSLTAGNEGGEA
jgi:RNA polymerase sigma factor (sigma-70 family)